MRIIAGKTERVQVFFDLASYFKEISVQRPGWTKLLVLAGISACLGLSLPVGYNIGVVNTPAAVSNESNYDIFFHITWISPKHLIILINSVMAAFFITVTVSRFSLDVPVKFHVTVEIHYDTS